MDYTSKKFKPNTATTDVQITNSKRAIEKNKFIEHNSQD